MRPPPFPSVLWPPGLGAELSGVVRLFSSGLCLRKESSALLGVQNQCVGGDALEWPHPACELC